MEKTGIKKRQAAPRPPAAGARGAPGPLARACCCAAPVLPCHGVLVSSVRSYHIRGTDNLLAAFGNIRRGLDTRGVAASDAEARAVAFRA